MLQQPLIIIGQERLFSNSRQNGFETQWLIIPKLAKKVKTLLSLYYIIKD